MLRETPPDLFSQPSFYNTIQAPESSLKVYNERARGLEKKILKWFKENPTAELTPLQVWDEMQKIHGWVHEGSCKRACTNLKSEKWGKALIGTGVKVMERYRVENELIKLNINQ